jgi:hypothetical protein
VDPQFEFTRRAWMQPGQQHGGSASTASSAKTPVNAHATTGKNAIRTLRRRREEPANQINGRTMKESRQEQRARARTELAGVRKPCSIGWVTQQCGADIHDLCPVR